MRYWMAVFGLVIGVTAMATVSPLASRVGAALLAQGPTAPDPNHQAAASLTDQLRRAASDARQGQLSALPSLETATQRRALLEQLAARDPTAVLALALAPGDREALPPETQALVEQHVTLDGELRIVHADYPNGRSQTSVVLATGSGPITLYPTSGPSVALAGAQVQATGVLLPGGTTAVTGPPRVLRAPVAAGTTGNQRTAILLVNAQGQSGHPYANDKAATANVMFSTTSGVSARAYYEEVSYNQTFVVGGSGQPGTAADVYGPYTLSTSTCDINLLYRPILDIADRDVDYNSYDRIVALYNHSATTPLSCGYGGISFIGQFNPAVYDGNFQTLGFMIVTNTFCGIL